MSDVTTTTVYAEKFCADCDAPFRPSSGRQRYCELHREPKFRTARDSEQKAARRARPEWRPPVNLTIFGEHRRRERRDWVAEALRLARLAGDMWASRRLVELAERTARGEVDVAGCHHLGDLLGDVSFRLSDPLQRPRSPSGQGCTAKAIADMLASLRPAEAPPDMSVSRWWEAFGYEVEADALADSRSHGWAWVTRTGWST